MSETKTVPSIPLLELGPSTQLPVPAERSLDDLTAKFGTHTTRPSLLLLVGHGTRSKQAKP